MIGKYLSANLRHITPADFEILREGEEIQTFIDHEASAIFVWVTDNAQDQAFYWKRAGFSQAFVKLMTKASELRVQYLFLHENGEELPDLERFDWEEDESETEAESQGQDEDGDEDDEEEEEEPTKFLLHYRCYRCGHQWEDTWTSIVDDDCGECGARHCSPYKWEDL
jgi:hypothetical protein